MTAGRGPIEASRVMNDPILSIPFDAVLFVAVVLGCLFAAWSAVGLGDAYKSIGR